MKLKIKYCGGCNPVINRKKIVDEVVDCLRASIPVEITREEADAALVVCGCPVACAEYEDIAKQVDKVVLVAGNSLDHYQIPRDLIAAKACQILMGKEEKEIGELAGPLL